MLPSAVPAPFEEQAAREGQPDAALRLHLWLSLSLSKLERQLLG